MSKYSDVVPVGRDQKKLGELQGERARLGINQVHPTKSAQGWDLSFATNHLGPFVLTEALMPHLPDGANFVFVASGVEDPERKLAKAVGFRGGRYISAEASARGDWKPGGSKIPGADAYATSKQNTLATAMVFAGEIAKVLMNESGATGVYYDDRGNPMLSSELARDPQFTARVVSETRALLATVQTASTGQRYGG